MASPLPSTCAHNGPLLRSSQPRYTPYQTAMTYFNNFSNSGFYSAPFASYESATYPFMNQMLANEGQNAYKFTSATDDWRTRGQPSLFTGHQAGAGFGKDNHSSLLRQNLTRGSPGSTTSLIPNAAYTHGYGLPLSSGPNWSATDQAQPRCSSFVDWSTSFADTVTSESTTMIAAPSRGKHLFVYEVSRIRVLTDCKQPCSTTGEATRVGRPPPRPTW